jgi:Na+/proline symporter
MLTRVDYVVIAMFFVFQVGLGWIFRSFGKDSSQYFRGGGRMSWWLVGTSAFMGAFSAWTFTGAAGLAYEQGLIVMVIYWAGSFGFFWNWLCFAEWFRQTRVITAMEAVRARLGAGNEQFFTWLTLPIGVIVAGIWLYGLAIFCAPVFGFELRSTVLVCGAAVVFVAAAGGQWAIVAGDFVQALILLAIAIVAAVSAWFKVGGWSGFATGLPATHWDLSASHSVEFGGWWIVALVVEKFFSQNALHGASRYLNVRDGREAKRAALLAAALYFSGSILWFVPPLAARALGMDLAAAFPGLTKPAEAAYVAVAAQCLPAGLMGLMITGIVSATLSSMDHGLNRNAGVFVRSVYVPLLRPRASEREQVLAGRIATLAFGGIVILTALFYSSWKEVGVFNLMMGFSSLVGVPYAVPMVWCMVLRRVPDWAAWSGVLVGIAAGALAGSGPGWASGWFPAESWTGQMVIWAQNHRYVSVTLSGALVSTAWYLAASWGWGNRMAPARVAQINEFFARTRTRIEPETEGATVAINERGTGGIGRLCLVYAVFILILAALPNPWKARGAIAFCALFVGGCGGLLVHFDRRRRDAAR